MNPDTFTLSSYFESSFTRRLGLAACPLPHTADRWTEGAGDVEEINFVTICPECGIKHAKEWHVESHVCKRCKDGLGLLP